MDQLIDTRPGRELLRPVYDDPAHAVGRRDLPLRWLHRRLPAADRRRPGHRQHGHGLRGTPPQAGLRRRAARARPTTSSRPRPTSTTWAGWTCSSEDGHPLRRPAEQPALPGRRRPHPRPCACAPPASGSTCWAPTPGASPQENPGVSMRQAEPVPDVTFDQLPRARRRRAAAGAASPPWGRPSTARSSGSPSGAPRWSATSSVPSSPTSRTSTRCGGTATASSSRTSRACARCAPCGPRCSSPAGTSRSSGADLIDACLARLHGAVDYVHQRALEGFNAGADVWTLMERDSAAARAARRPGLRQGLLGRAHALGELRRLVQAAVDHRALSRQCRAALAELLDAAGTDAALDRAEAALGRGEATLAIRLGEAVVVTEPDSPAARAVLAAAHRFLLEHGGDISFWENGWLRDQLARWEP